MDIDYDSRIDESYQQLWSMLSQLADLFSKPGSEDPLARRAIDAVWLALDLWNQDFLTLKAASRDFVQNEALQSTILERLISATQAAERILVPFEKGTWPGSVNANIDDIKGAVRELQENLRPSANNADPVQWAGALEEHETTYAGAKSVNRFSKYREPVRDRLRKLRHLVRFNRSTDPRTFASIRESLATKIALRAVSKDDAFAEFIPVSTMREICINNPIDVKDLFLLASTCPGFESRKRDTERAEEFFDTVIGPEEPDSSHGPAIPMRTGLSDVLGVLIWTRIDCPSPEWSYFEDMCFRPDRRLASINGSDRSNPLPIAKSQLNKWSDKLYWRQVFYTSQFVFCPMVLERNQFHHLDELPYRVPYWHDSKEPLGRGSAGRVYKVIIAKGHLESSKSVNKRTLPLARKEFTKEECGDLEWNINQRFMLSSVTKHAYIMKPIAGFRQGDVCNVFYRLADSNLKEYMKNDESRPPDKKRMHALGQFVHLASALEFLHNGIQTPNTARTSCFHLDLKPENILVVHDDRQRCMFKITDFSISKLHFRQGSDMLKIAPTGQSSDDENVAPKDAVQDVRDQNTSSELRANSTYISPEGKVLDGRVSSRSDVWAFGCLLCTLLSWYAGGWKGLQAFRMARQVSDRYSHFFQMTSDVGPASESVYAGMVYDPDSDQPVEKQFHVNEAVPKLFEALLGTPESQDERVMYAETKDLVLEHVLLVNPDKREIRMGDIQRSMMETNNRFRKQPISS